MLAVEIQGYTTGFKCYPERALVSVKNKKEKRSCDWNVRASRRNCSYTTAVTVTEVEKERWQNCVKGDIIVVECHRCSSFFFQAFLYYSLKEQLQKAAIKTGLPLPLWFCFLYIIYLNLTNYEHRRRWELSFKSRYIRQKPSVQLTDLPQTRI